MLRRVLGGTNVEGAGGQRGFLCGWEARHADPSASWEARMGCAPPDVAPLARSASRVLRSLLPARPPMAVLGNLELRCETCNRKKGAMI